MSSAHLEIEAATTINNFFVFFSKLDIFLRETCGAGHLKLLLSVEKKSIQNAAKISNNFVRTQRPHFRVPVFVALSSSLFSGSVPAFHDGDAFGWVCPNVSNFFTCTGDAAVLEMNVVGVDVDTTDVINVSPADSQMLTSRYVLVAQFLNIEEREIIFQLSSDGNWKKIWASCKKSPWSSNKSLLDILGTTAMEVSSNNRAFLSQPALGLSRVSRVKPSHFYFVISCVLRSKHFFVSLSCVWPLDVGVVG